MKKQGNTRLIVAAVLTILCALLALVPFNGLDGQGKGVMIVFIWAIIMWIVRPIPEYLIGVIAAAILAIFFGSGTRVVSGFSSSGWWLCLWAGFIGVVIQYSGLGERIAYAFMLKFVRDAKSLIISIFALTFVLSLLIPPLPALECNMIEYRDAEDCVDYYEAVKRRSEPCPVAVPGRMHGKD